MSTPIQVFDPPQCCSTGVCGPTVDPLLARFAADLEWLRRQGATVERHNLAQQPAAFAAQADVNELLSRDGLKALPAVRVDGRIVSHGRYPSRAELAAWAGVPLTAALPVTACGSPGCC